MNNDKIIICVTGASSNSGKTTTACMLIERLKNCAALKTVTVTNEEKHSCPKGKPCGVCESLCSNWDLYEDIETITKEGTDTAKLYNAGARPTLWLVTKIDYLKEAFLEILAKIDNHILIIEGNGVPSIYKCDINIMVLSTNGLIKKSAYKILKYIDFFVILDKNRKSIDDIIKNQPFELNKPIYCLDDSKDREKFLNNIEEKINGK